MAAKAEHCSVLEVPGKQTAASSLTLGPDVTVQTERGERQFADNDCILFLKNEREFGVKNGTLGTIEKAASDSMAVRLDDGRRIAVDLKSYAHAAVAMAHRGTISLLAPPGFGVSVDLPIRGTE